MSFPYLSTQTSTLGNHTSTFFKVSADTKCPSSITTDLSTMRKIERQIIQAIQENKDLKVDNSEVISCSHVSDVYLHGNLIARIGETWMELFDGGYQSNTTKSRLNALLSAFGMEGEYVFQKNFQWFINYQGSPIPFLLWYEVELISFLN
jgi:hypothetical protein